MKDDVQVIRGYYSMMMMMLLLLLVLLLWMRLWLPLLRLFQLRRIQHQINNDSLVSGI